MVIFANVFVRPRVVFVNSRARARDYIFSVARAERVAARFAEAFRPAGHAAGFVCSTARLVDEGIRIGIVHFYVHFQTTMIWSSKMRAE